MIRYFDDIHHDSQANHRARNRQAEVIESGNRQAEVIESGQVIVVYRGIVLKGVAVAWRAAECRYTRLFAEQDARQFVSAQLFSFEYTATYQEERITGQKAT